MYGQLRPVVLPYTHEHLSITDPFRLWTARIALLLVGALVFVVAVNLAILMYARTVTRLGEIAVRTALGASRRRILAQLFVEALALSTVGAAAGLLLAHIALERMQSLARLGGGVPFWIELQLSAASVIYAMMLAVLAAAIMGVLPGVKATGSRRNAHLLALTGHSRARLGPVWTTLVVAQVAVAVAVLPMSVYMAWRVVRMEVAGPGFATDEFVVGIVALSDEASVPDMTANQETAARPDVAPGGRAWCVRRDVFVERAGVRVRTDRAIRGGAGREARGPAGRRRHDRRRSRAARRVRCPDDRGTRLHAGRPGHGARRHREPVVRRGSS